MEKDEQQKRSEVKCIVVKVLVTFSATRENVFPFAAMAKKLKYTM